uniref:Uncharacterized protein n=1 Tax=Candidatus Kentrum sp. TC TaxID=2126339 RepID=A0A451A844_9GAMM|nr:MAG: hypothetical protein BECKTC1821F_GA0114240_107110 [Candidatus Kentron sp. TC]
MRSSKSKLSPPLVNQAFIDYELSNTSGFVGQLPLVGKNICVRVRSTPYWDANRTRKPGNDTKRICFYRMWIPVQEKRLSSESTENHKSEYYQTLFLAICLFQ